MACVETHANVKAAKRLSITNHIYFKRWISTLEIRPQPIWKRGYVMHNAFIHRLKLEASATRLNLTPITNKFYNMVHLCLKMNRL